MIQQQSYLDIADNSGAKVAMCMKVLGGSTPRGKFVRKTAGVGDIISGLKDTDTPDLLTIKDSAGMYHDIPVDEVERKTAQKVSVMPEGLAGTMTKQELLDLVAYLSTLRNAE